MADIKSETRLEPLDGPIPTSVAFARDLIMELHRRPAPGFSGEQQLYDAAMKVVTVYLQTTPLWIMHTEGDALKP